MSKTFRIYPAVTLLMLVSLAINSSCSKDDSNNEDPVIEKKTDIGEQTDSGQVRVTLSHPYDSEVQAGSQELAYPLFAQMLNHEGGNKNFIVSPLSLSEALGMLATGANGETLDEITSVLGVPHLTPEQIDSAFYNLNTHLLGADQQVRLSIANSQWFDEEFPVKESYKTANSTFFDAETFVQDLQTTQTMHDINSWCDSKTNGRIEKILSEQLNGSVKVMLINALYFNAKWISPFNEQLTKKALFTAADGTQTEVDMMHQQTYFGAVKREKYDMMEMLYGNGLYAMDLILPHEGETLSDCLAGFDKQTFDSDLQAMKTYNVTVAMPRMELNYNTSLVPMLNAMGMTEAFGDADFSNVSDKPLYVSDIKQFAYITIDEKGTEAAAVTAEDVETSNIGEYEDLDFLMNRPFTFIIREKNSGVILFMGIVASFA